MRPTRVFGALTRLRPLLLPLALAALVLAPFRAYLDGAMLLFGDANLPWTPSLVRAMLASYRYAWLPALSGGISSIVIHESQAYQLPFAALSVLGLGFASAVIYPLALAVLVAGCLVAARAFGLSRGAAYAVAAAVSVNPWIWDQLLAGHIAIVFAVATSPWCLASLAWTPRRPVRALLVGSLTCALALLFDPRTTSFIAAGFVVVTLARSFRGPPWRLSDRRTLARAWSALLCLPLAFLANAAWTLPFVLVHDANPVPHFYPPLEDLLSYRAFGEPAYALVFSPYFIHFAWASAAGNGPLCFAAWYAAVVALEAVAFAVARSWSRRYAVAAACFGVGFFLSMGLNGVPAPLLEGFYLHVPFAELLREPVKFTFLMLVGVAIATGVAWDRGSRMTRVVLAGSLAVMALPALGGTLRTAAGHGLQPMAYPTQFRAMLDTVTRADPARVGRLVFFPPWLAEQSQAPGFFYAANPFVFQNDVPVVDAKLVKTATRTDQAAWRALERIAWGTDGDLATALDRLGIEFVALNPDAVLSPGGASTPFVHGVATLARRLAADPDFTRLYADGPFVLYRNARFTSPFRVSDGVPLLGWLPGRWRAALPAGTVADTLELPPGASDIVLPHLAVGGSSLDRCVTGATDVKRVRAYDFVGRHSDFRLGWVAGDYRERFGGRFEAEQSADFEFPYAYTESHAALTVPVTAARAGRIYAQLGAVGTSDVRVSVDGGEASDLRPALGRLEWVSLGAAPPGLHRVTFVGARAGVALGAVAVVYGGCHDPGGVAIDAAGPAAPGSVAYDIPTDVPAVTARRARNAFRVTADFGTVGGTSLRRTRVLAVPRGTDALALDDVPLQDGMPSAVFAGTHQLEYLHFYDMDVHASWTGSAGTAAVTANAGARGVRLDADVQLPPGARYASVRIRGVSRLRDGMLGISSGGDVAARFPLAFALRHTLFVGPLSGPDAHLEIDAPARPGGALTVVPPRIRPGWPLEVAGSGASLTLDPGAVRVPASRMPAMPLTKVEGFELAADGSLMPRRGELLAPYVPVDPARGYLLRLTGVTSAAGTRITVDQYSSAPGSITDDVVADVAASARILDVPLVRRPFTQMLAFAIRQEDGAARIASIDLYSFDLARLGHVVTVDPRARDVSRPIAAAATPVSFVVGRPATQFLTRITYDPGWSLAGSEPFIVDGTSNAWVGVRRGLARYAPQATYLACTGVSFGVVALLLAGLIASEGRGRRRGSRSRPDRR